MENKDKKLKLMRYWLLGANAIVFAAITAVMYLFTFGNIWKAIASGWLVWGTAIVLGIAFYFGYKVFLDNTEE